MTGVSEPVTFGKQLTTDSYCTWPCIRYFIHISNAYMVLELWYVYFNFVDE